MPWSMRTEGGQVLVVRQRDKKVVGRHKDRKRALAQLRVLSSLEKAQFASRSEAGRYAANMRWQGQGKKEQKSTKSPLAKRLLEAESSLKQKGFKTAVIGLKVGEEKYEKFLKSVYKIVGEQRKSLNPDDFSNKEWNEISRAYHYMQMASPDMQTMKRFGISAKRPDNVIVIYGKDKEVAGVMSFQILEELFHGAKGPKNSEKIGRGVFSRPVMDLELAGSSHKHKGVGSALFAQAVRTASKNNLGLRLTSHINAESFWESVGFKAEGSNSDGMKIYRLSEKEVKDLAKSLGSGGSNDFKP